MFLFLFELLIVKLKYTNSMIYHSYCKNDYVTDQCVLRKLNPEHYNRCVL
jgi:hypothetical protein